MENPEKDIYLTLHYKAESDKEGRIRRIQLVSISGKGVQPPPLWGGLHLPGIIEMLRGTISQLEDNPQGEITDSWEH